MSATTHSVARTFGLTVTYGDLVALDGVDVQLERGVTGLVGANGAGKSTLLKALLGLLVPKAGRVELLGRDVAEDPVGARQRVGFMPEDRCLPADQTAADFVTFAGELSGLPRREARRRASEVLAVCGLGESRFRPIGEFSTGMTQRTKLAQALVHGPDLLLLDEPASGLDPEGREELLDVVTRLGRAGLSVVLSSHILDDVEATCDQLVVVEAGKVVRAGPIGDLRGDGSLLVEVVGDATAVAELLAQRGAAVETRPGGLRVRGDGDSDVATLVRDAVIDADAGLRRMSTSSRSLEEVVLEAVEGRP